jgi:hypothetical protein
LLVITIDKHSYDLDTPSDEAKAQLQSLQFVRNQRGQKTLKGVRPTPLNSLQQALKLLDIHEDATDVLEQLNDTPLTLGGRKFAPSEGLDGLLLELADDFRHYIEATPWWKLQWHLWTRKRPWLALLTTEN